MLYRECETCKGGGVLPLPDSSKDNDRDITISTCPDCQRGFVEIKPAESVKALALKVRRRTRITLSTDLLDGSKTTAGCFVFSEEEAVAKIAAFIEAQKPEVSKDVKGLTERCFEPCVFRSPEQELLILENADLLVTVFCDAQIRQKGIDVNEGLVTTIERQRAESNRLREALENALSNDLDESTTRQIQEALKVKP